MINKMFNDKLEKIKQDLNELFIVANYGQRQQLAKFGTKITDSALNDTRNELYVRRNCDVER
jgi:hypothetical protein